MLARYIRFFLENKLFAYLFLLLFVLWGLVTAPFDFGWESLPRDPVSVDAIPDIGENQQIVFTQWPGRSPQDVEDQISYPLTTALLGIPGVKSIRSNSMFGFSSIYLIFNDEVDFYWSRSRILEKLNSLPANLLPPDAQPALGPDATALGQIFWYTLEGQDENGQPTGGWDLQELRSIQDFYVRYGLSGAEGVAEVASIGGFVKEYQVDVDPDAMRINNISLEQVMRAVQESNLDVGAQTLEINQAEYFVRGLGYVKDISDIEEAVVTAQSQTPLRIKDIARVSLGPANRRGVLDKSGAEAVGGVVVARYGSNPLQVIQNVKAKIAEIEPGLASKVLADGTTSQVKIVPFYDRTQLINETIGTLEEALSLEILITIIVVILMLLNLKSSLLVSSTLPVAVLMCFIAMRYFGVDANIVALSGIAIAIGTMVDMGIVLTESMVNRMEAEPQEDLQTTIFEATKEVASAVLTAVATTVISFLPVFTMEAAEGKLFRPLAFTKTFALVAAVIVAITIIPPLAHTLFSLKSTSKIGRYLLNGLASLVGLLLAVFYDPFYGGILIFTGLVGALHVYLQQRQNREKVPWIAWLTSLVYALVVAWLLAKVWMPLGVDKSNGTNFLFVTLLVGGLIGFFYLIIHFYENILGFLLRFKLLFLLLVGLIVYQGYQVFQNTGEEFMPALDEGSFLLMPTAMPHAGTQENLKNLRLLDMAVTAIPEVDMVVGKAGRVSSPLDPAPMSMYENVIQYKTEYKTDASGRRLRFKFEDGAYVRDEAGDLVPDEGGRYFRQWRDEIRSPDDIWAEIVRVSNLPGLTSAPKLQPIETRLVMLQTGMRAPMGIKVGGPDLASIEAFGLQLEQALKQVEGVKKAAVFADRIVGKPYLLLDIKRKEIARHGLSVAKVQQYIQTAIGGMPMTTTVEGRERYNIRIRYPRELRDDPEALKRVLIPTANGRQIPLETLVDIRYEAGAQSIKSEDGFLVSYVLFDREKDHSEVEVVNQAQAYLEKQIDNGAIAVPAGVSYRFAGNYEQQVRANQRLAIVVPIALVLIFLILYLQFRSVAIALMVFSGVFIAFAGGFIMIGLYDTAWFLDFSLFGTDMRTLFQIRPINLSVAVWVGFLALFGIATDDGVLVATFLKDSFQKNQPDSVETIRAAVIEGGLRRVRPAMMTTATTILALLPILTSTGRGSDIMLPMAIPSFGGMTLQVVTMFTVPVLYALWKEAQLFFKKQKPMLGLNKRLGSMMILSLLIGGNALQAQSLDQLANQVLESNLELKMLRTQHLADLERAPQVSQLPDPELSIGAFPLPVETRLGAQQFRLGIYQSLPWFGTLAQRTKLSNTAAKVSFERVQAKALDQLFQLEEAYLQLYELLKSQDILKRDLDLFKSLENLALARVESGKGSAADVLSVQLEAEALRQEIALLQQATTVPRTTINQLRNADLNQPIRIQDSLTFAPLPFNQDTLLAYMASNHPVLQMYQQQQRVAEQTMLLNDLDRKPTLGFGADYITVSGRTDAFPVNNGRDIVQVRATLKVPLYQKQYDAKNREEQLKVQALDQQKAHTLSYFQSQVQQAYAAHASAGIQIASYKKQKALTRSRSRIFTADYSTEGSNFDQLLRTEKELIDYDLKILKAIVQSHRAKSNIQRFVRPL